MYQLNGNNYFFNNSAFNKVLSKALNSRHMTLRNFTIDLYKHLHNDGFSEEFILIKSDEDYETARKRISRWRMTRQPKPYDPNLIFSIEKFLGLSKGALLKSQEEHTMKKNEINNIAVATKIMDIHTQICDFIENDCMDGNENLYSRLLGNVESLELFSDAFTKLKEFLNNAVAPIVFNESEAVLKIEEPYLTSDGNLNFNTEHDFLTFMGKHFEITMTVKEQYMDFFRTQILKEYLK